MNPALFPDTTGTRCVIMHWPGSQSAYDLRHNAGKTWAWHGSLIEDQRDGSGWGYRRARLVDPLTGRFTQVDPIGIAGGVNVFGFANGDPVNFSDPFGLAAGPPCKVRDLRCLAFLVSLRIHNRIVEDGGISTNRPQSKPR